MSATPHSTDVSYQDLNKDVYEIANAAHIPVGVVSLVGDSDWIAICYRGIIVGRCPDKTTAATRLLTHSADHSHALSRFQPRPPH
jgi:hypothetical protein